MGGVKYGVEVEFKKSGSIDAGLGVSGAMTKVSDLGNQLGGLGEKFVGGFGRSLDSVGSLMLGSVEKASMAAGGLMAAGIAGALKEGLNFGAYYEDSVNGIAATMSMLGDIPIDKGLKQANESAEHLRKMAAVLPGEFKDAANAFGAILPAGMNAGVDMGRLEKLGAQSVAVAASLGIKQGVAGHELAAILEGRARGSMPLVSKMGLHATQINAMPEKERWSKVEGMFGKMESSGAMTQFAGSWSGLTSTIKDNSRNVAKTFAAPLFESMKAEMGKGLTWFGAHEDEVHGFATKVGEAVAYGFRRGEEFLFKWIPIAVTFGQTLYDWISRGVGLFEPYMKRFGGMAEKFMSNPNAGHMLGSAAVAAGGLYAGREGLDLGVAGLKTFGPMLGAAGYSAAELSAACIPAAAGVALLGAGMYGAYDILTDVGNNLHDFGTDMVAGTSKDLAALGKDASSAAADLRPVADLLGADILLGFRLAAAGLANFGMVLEAVTHSASTWLNWMGVNGGLRPMQSTDYVDLSKERDTMMSMALNPIKRLDDAGNNDKIQAALKPPVHKTTVNATVHITIPGAGDPTRVAKAVGDLLHDTKRLGSSSNPSAAWMKR